MSPENHSPDSPNLRVRTPSKSQATPLNMTLLIAKWMFMNCRTILNILNAKETLKNTNTRYSRNYHNLKTRGNEKRCSMGKRLTN